MKKILLGLGSVVAIATPVATVVSCDVGDDSGVAYNNGLARQVNYEMINVGKYKLPAGNRYREQYINPSKITSVSEYYASQKDDLWKKTEITMGSDHIYSPLPIDEILKMIKQYEEWGE